jgi:hypothetical protein
VIGEVAAALAMFSSPKEMAEAIAAGKVPHTAVRF